MSVCVCVCVCVCVRMYIYICMYGSSVVVSAPTGSGKTVCGEAAVYLGVAMGKRVLYTTPLKALSNQKYNDFCAQFGAERVGLLTGDVSINRQVTFF